MLRQLLSLINYEPLNNDSHGAKVVQEIVHHFFRLISHADKHTRKIDVLKSI